MWKSIDCFILGPYRYYDAIQFICLLQGKFRTSIWSSINNLNARSEFEMKKTHRLRVGIEEKSMKMRPIEYLCS